MVKKSVKVKILLVIALLLALVYALQNILLAENKLKLTTIRIQPKNAKEVIIEAETACNVEEWNRGLTGRSKLAVNTGMLFVFPEPLLYSFWMKNTSLNLSIAFIASDGKILEIHNMKPLSEKPIVPSKHYQFALEITKGYFSENSIQEGDLLAFNNIC